MVKRAQGTTTDDERACISPSIYMYACASLEDGDENLVEKSGFPASTKSVGIIRQSIITGARVQLYAYVYAGVRSRREKIACHEQRGG